MSNSIKTGLHGERSASRLSARSVPASLSEGDRSCGFVIATEAPVEVWDWQSFAPIREVLRMDGMEIPPSGQVPMLDSHDAGSVSRVLGSFSGIHVEGSEALGTARFSEVPEAETAWTLVREGHLTDVSVGYRVLEFTDVPDGMSAEIGGREYSGPVRVTTRWQLFEISLCPIGADQGAKARQKEAIMPNAKRSDEIDVAAVKEGIEAAVSSLTAVAGLLAGKEEEPEAVPEAEAVAEGDGIEEGREDAQDQEEGESPADPDEGREEADEEDKAEERAARRERRRIGEIAALCRAHGISDAMREKFIQEGYAMDKVREAVLNSISARSGAGFARVEVGETEAQKVRSAARDGLAMRCGVNVAKPAAGASEFRGMTMREICRELLARSGQSTGGTAMDIVGRAIATTDLPALLTETANRVLLDGWEAGEHGWQIWCGKDQAADFKSIELIDFAAGDDLELVREGGEYHNGRAAEHKETVKLETYGKIFPLTRQALVNDDLGAFSRLARAHGEAAARKVNALAFGVLTANAAMSDGVALFHATHRNLCTSGGGTPDVTKLGAAFKAMKTQKDALGNPIQIRPQYFIAPVALETAAEVFFTSQMIGTQAQPLQNNIYGGSVLTRVYDAELDASSESTWYLAGPQGKTVTLFFLNGADQPYLEEQAGWRVDGIEYKVRLDVAAKAVAWQGLCKSAS